MLKRTTIARFVRHQLAHTGENVCHIMYLTFTVVEGHGIHAMFAGGVVFFIAVSKFMHLGGGVEE
ncbi:hypothetical protein D3C87_1606220 [compost metagenome]